jgi:hypothetical protein
MCICPASSNVLYLINKEMKGSDLDIMYVIPSVRVYEDINKVRFNSRKTSFVMDMDDCKLGFTHLRLNFYTNVILCVFVQLQVMYCI